MTFAAFSLRSFAVAATFATVAASASALTLPTESLQTNSVQAFSEKSLTQNKLLGIEVTPLGNATATATSAPDIDTLMQVTPLGNATATATTGAYNLPVTSISVNSSLKVTSGAAVGSALEISRLNDDLVKVGITLANFKINFETHQVLADVTPFGGVTVPQQAVYTFNEATPLNLKYNVAPIGGSTSTATFNEATPLNLKYKFPLTITGTQLLDKLFLTPAGIAALTSALELPEFAPDLLVKTDFGTINIDVKVGTRKAVSTKPYVPAN
jgi:hypothetical protein